MILLVYHLTMISRNDSWIPLTKDIGKFCGENVCPAYARCSADEATLQYIDVVRRDERLTYLPILRLKRNTAIPFSLVNREKMMRINFFNLPLNIRGSSKTLCHLTPYRLRTPVKRLPNKVFIITNFSA